MSGFSGGGGVSLSAANTWAADQTFTGAVNGTSVGPATFVSLHLRTNGTDRWKVNDNGNLMAEGGYNIGASPISGAPATVFATTAFVLGALNINAQTGTSYTLVAADNGKTITLNNAAAITLTVPASLGSAFSCTLVQIGAGQVTIVASGVTLNSFNSLVKIAGQNGAASLFATAADVFNLSGNLSA